MITVMGATGNVGGHLSRSLLAAGHDVRVLSRSAARVADLERIGAQVCVGDSADPAFLAAAFGGSDAVFTMLPFDPTWPQVHATMDRLGMAIEHGLRESGVRHVVALSSLGAQRASGTGFIASLHAHEQRMRRLGIDVVLLRPGLFFESHAAALEVISQRGVNGDSVDPDVRLPMIATTDIADVAARELTARDWDGVVVRELLGPRDHTYAEVTSILGEAIGIPGLDYVRFADEQMRSILVESGFSADAAENYVEMTRAFNDATVAVTVDSPLRTGTRFEDFARTLAAEYVRA